VLSPLQERVAAIITSLDEAEGFALAGGAALIARGDVQRQTRDLDFFGLTPAAVDRLVPAIDRALQEAGLVVRHFQESPGFARLIVESGDDRTELDLGADARLFPAESGRLGPTLNGEELAVFGRAEARDFVDLAAVEERYGLDRLFERAAEKDRGFMSETFGEMAGRFSRLRPDEFGIDSAQYERLKRKVAEWQGRGRSR
jgi:Nucleotidyl transferase AbiEii toxin, Type IV TA system